MNITRITVTSGWQKIDDIISASEGEIFEIQNVGGHDVLICINTNEPVETKDGFLLKPNRAGLYTKETGFNLYFKAKDNNTIINVGKSQ